MALRQLPCKIICSPNAYDKHFVYGFPKSFYFLSSVGSNLFKAEIGIPAKLDLIKIVLAFVMKVLRSQSLS